MTTSMESNEVISGLSCNIREWCLMRLLISTPTPVCGYQSVECAFTSPVSIESGVLVTTRMQNAMSVSTVL